MNNTTYETLLFNVVDHIATLTLNRPEQRNALNLQMCRDLVAVCEHVKTNIDIRVLLVKATGNIFCAGADLKERQGMTSADMLARRVEGFTAYAAIEDLEIPVIAVMQGPAVGSGGEIAASCDFVLASTRAGFRYPEVGWGTVGATQRLPRVVGRRMAKEMLYTGRMVDAVEAKSLGLVNHVFEPDQLEHEASAMAAAIAKCNPLTVRLSKKSLDDGLETTRRGAMAIELVAIQENLRHSDWKGAIAEFGKSTTEQENEN